MIVTGSQHRATASLTSVSSQGRSASSSNDRLRAKHVKQTRSEGLG